MFACVADCGWITGHTYTIYGPLSLGSTTVIFESVPTYPNPYRYWDCVQRHKITQFYTAPTAIRALMKFDAAPIADYDLSSLRVLGSVRLNECSSNSLCFIPNIVYVCRWANPSTQRHGSGTSITWVEDSVICLIHTGKLKLVAIW